MKLTLIFCCAICALFISVPVRADDASPDYEEPNLSPFDRDHWSFHPLVRPDLPAAYKDKWCENEIDAFILHRLQKKSLSPQIPADRVTLIRRLSFDLTGLPPTPEEIDAFANDASPEAYARLVDRLLESPHYGARWGQFWLDLARFAETDGFEHDKVRSESWRYRDWVVRAANDDLPYDQFMSLQVAGDLLRPGDDDAATATAFCLSGPDMPDINSQEERKHYLLNEMAGTVGSVFLGLQLGCAQCHDHMFDPVSQADFYRLRAFFEDSVQLRRDVSVFRLAQSSDPATSRVWIRGNWRRPGPEVHANFPRVLISADATTDSNGSASRVALANWLSNADANPLPARVLANRVWQFHFGRGINNTPSDFGIAGELPTHPELLDWLATELVRGRWSVKHLHRVIVMSATYRQASERDVSSPAEAWNKLLQSDPPNELLGRFPRRRLDGEAIRDAMLVVAGQLNEERSGPGVCPPLAEELRATLLNGQWEVSAREADHYRRSIYVFARRNLRYPIFELFDRPDANASCARRNKSTTAPQALLLFNSTFSLEIAQHLAARSLAEGGTLEEAAARAARRAWGRSLTVEEAEGAREFLNREGSSDEALIDYCLALINANQFLYVD
jgi:hypothetical protein